MGSGLDAHFTGLLERPEDVSNGALGCEFQASSEVGDLAPPQTLPAVPQSSSGPLTLLGVPNSAGGQAAPLHLLPALGPACTPVAPRLGMHSVDIIYHCSFLLLPVTCPPTLGSF